MYVILPVDGFERQAVGDVFDEVVAVTSTTDPKHVLVFALGEELAIPPVRVEREEHWETVAEDAETDLQQGEKYDKIYRYL